MSWRAVDGRKLARMPDPKDAPRQPTGAGLCDSCAHQQIVRNTRGSVFSLCRRSRSDPAYPRYPRVPVLSCPGFERGVGEES
jgi:hypothetical protein